MKRKRGEQIKRQKETEVKRDRDEKILGRIEEVSNVKRDN